MLQTLAGLMALPGNMIVGDLALGVTGAFYWKNPKSNTNWLIALFEIDPKIKTHLAKLSIF